jgi:mycofactocin glycosyltransferase
MAEPRPCAPSPVEHPVPAGTRVELDAAATLRDRRLVSGGSPWRLLRLPGAAREVVERWSKGGTVRVGEERFARTLVQQGLVHPHHLATFGADDVDVVIPVRDDVASLRRLCRSLEGLHLTIVDDGSTCPEPLAECATRFAAQLVRLESNEGPGAARNAGFAATTRPLVWCVDTDVDIEDPPALLTRLLAPFTDPLVGAVAPRVRGAEGPSARDRFERLFGPLDMGPRGGLVVPGAAVGYVPSACLMVRRSAAGAGFDASLRHGEDVDFVWRLHDEGWLVRYLADVQVTHWARRTWHEWWAQRANYGASSAQLARRHGARLAPVRTDAWTVAAWLSVLARRPLIALRLAALARGQLARRLSDVADEPGRVASALVARGMGYSIGPLARSVVRTYGPLVVLAALHPRLRRGAVAIFVLGTAWRWRRVPVRAADVPIAIADDLAYGLGVWRGSWRARTWRALTPQVTTSSIDVRELLARSILAGR